MPTYEFGRAMTAVDVVMLTVPDFWTSGAAEPRLEVALVMRPAEPFAGKLALPGTIVRVDADDQGRVDRTDLDAARRVVAEKMTLKPPHLEQLYTWYRRDWDPRGPVTVISYFALVPFDHFRKVSDGVLTFRPVDDLPKLAFQHNTIVASAVERVRGKAMYSSLPGLLMPECFTLRELMAMYEAVLGRTGVADGMDLPNFSRKIAKLGILELVEDRDQKAARQAEHRNSARGRRPELYRLSDRSLHTFGRTEFDAMPVRRTTGERKG